MKYMIFLMMLFCCAVTSSNADKAQKKWYEGGTLHQSKIKEWKKATAENKLATCADFMAKVINAKSMEDLRSKSINLRSCINAATEGIASTDSEKVSDIAALCVVRLGY